jgi:hypothetical protein
MKSNPSLPGTRPNAPRSADRQPAAVRALVCAGDLVTFGELDLPVYEILHVSDQKAWVRPLGEGTQRIVTVTELQLLAPKSAPVGRLN